MDQPTRLFDFARYQMEHFPLDNMMSSVQNGEWKTYSTSAFLKDADAMSRGLLALGVQPGDKVGIISHNNRSEWNITDFAVLQIGAIDVPIYPTMTEEDYRYIFNHAGLKYCFVSNDELFQKVKNVKPDVASLQDVFTFEQVSGARNWREVIESGEGNDHAPVEALAAKIKPEDLATIIYTSGTTGLPKGVMLSHRNIASNAVDSTPRLPKVPYGEGRVLSFLPVCHIYERMLHYMYIYNGAHIYFGQSLETIKEDLNKAQPHTFSAVPRLLEKFFDGIVAKGKEAGGIKTALFNWAVDLALAWEPEGQNGGFYEWKLGIARKLVFSKVKAALGLTEIRAVSSGSAALQPRLARFFNGAGIPVLEGYGLTETSPVVSVNTTNNKGMIRIGSVGKLLEHCEVKFEKDGEIMVKGPNVMMGYYKDPEKTAEVLEDGWFHTGDIGEMKDGFLRITDRKKEIFKTSGGKYVAPQLLENALKESLFIEQAMVVGENQKFPAAIIVPAYDYCREWCKRKKVDANTPEELVANKQLEERIWRDISEVMPRFGKWEQIKKIRLIADPFTIDGGELTPTLKLKRKPIKAKYQSVIDSFYEA